MVALHKEKIIVTILILIDGFLQCDKMEVKIIGFKSQSLF